MWMSGRDRRETKESDAAVTIGGTTTTTTARSSTGCCRVIAAGYVLLADEGCSPTDRGGPSSPERGYDRGIAEIIQDDERSDKLSA
ncbi:hypothetical protein PUN28_014556 [Cardiocondyla obscurior]|uniref:Uncharacterized protein n=1 Tax=Cardiocondyla obscurior TaxID=286306 RepID=A0AAW2F208_9HYME